MKPTDEQVLDAIANYGDEWTPADGPYRSLRSQGFDVTVIGIGRRLSRLAREGRCEARHDYMGWYRVPRFGPCTTLTPDGPCGSTELDATHHCAKCGALV